MDRGLGGNFIASLMPKSRGTQEILDALGKKNKKYAFFLTHHKRDAAAVVNSLRSDLARQVGLTPSYIFLDSEDLRDLLTLRDSVKASLVLVAVLTKDVFTRPWCLAEIITAIENNIPIVSINVEGQGNTFDFQATQVFLQSPSFSADLDAINPGAVEELTKQGIDVDAMAKSIGGLLPYLIAKPYNVSATERVRDAQLSDIVQVLREKIK